MCRAIAGEARCDKPWSVSVVARRRLPFRSRRSLWSYASMDGGKCRIPYKAASRDSSSVRVSSHIRVSIHSRIRVRSRHGIRVNHHVMLKFSHLIRVRRIRVCSSIRLSSQLEFRVSRQFQVRLRIRDSRLPAAVSEPAAVTVSKPAVVSESTVSESVNRIRAESESTAMQQYARLGQTLDPSPLYRPAPESTPSPRPDPPPPSSPPPIPPAVSSSCYGREVMAVPERRPAPLVGPGPERSGPAAHARAPTGIPTCTHANMLQQDSSRRPAHPPPLS